jgi:hypothetical protein
MCRPRALWYSTTQDKGDLVTTDNIRKAVAAALAAIVVVIVIVLVSSHHAPAPVVVTTPGASTVNLRPGDCKTSDVTFSPPGPFATIKTGTFAGITITNTSGHACHFALAASQTTQNTTVHGYGLVFATAWNAGAPLGKVSVLRGGTGSKKITLSDTATPSAEFTVGLVNTSLIKNCQPQTVTTVAFSLDGMHWQPVQFVKSSKQGLVICTAAPSLNTSPISLIPSHPTHATTTIHHATHPPKKKH